VELFQEKFPPTVETAVDKIMSDLSIREKTKIANMNEDKLIAFHKSYATFITYEFRLWGNDPLLKSCAEAAGLAKVTPGQASYVILKELQNRIRQTNVLRVVT